MSAGGRWWRAPACEMPTKMQLHCKRSLRQGKILVGAAGLCRGLGCLARFGFATDTSGSKPEPETKPEPTPQPKAKKPTASPISTKAVAAVKTSRDHPTRNGRQRRDGSRPEYCRRCSCGSWHFCNKASQPLASISYPADKLIPAPDELLRTEKLFPRK